MIAYNLSASTEWNEKRVNVNVSHLYTATGDYFCFVLCHALQGERVYVSFRVCLSGMDDFLREWYDSTVVWVQIFYLFVIHGRYLVFTMYVGGVHAFMNCSLRLGWSEEVKPVLSESEEQ